MKSKTNESIPCAIFGHNYVRSKSFLDHSIELTCKHCDAVILTDQNGNFESNPISNSQIKETLQELYRLSNRFHKAKVS